MMVVAAALAPTVLLSQETCPQSLQPKTKQALIDLEHRWARALEQHDSAAVDCLLAPEFVDTGVNGELHDRAQALAAIPNRKPLLNDLRDLQVTIAGEAAIVHGVNRVTDQEKKELARVRFTDVFLYRNGQWKAISGQETLVRAAPKQ
jgi:hypothetical protein